MQTLPERSIESAAGPALLISFQSVTSPARIDVLVADATLAFVEVAQYRT